MQSELVRKRFLMFYDEHIMTPTDCMSIAHALRLKYSFLDLCDVGDGIVDTSLLSERLSPDVSLYFLSRQHASPAILDTLRSLLTADVVILEVDWIDFQSITNYVSTLRDPRYLTNVYDQPTWEDTESQFNSMIIDSFGTPVRYIAIASYWFNRSSFWGHLKQELFND